jgi:hypothetical protein
MVSGYLVNFYTNINASRNLKAQIGITDLDSRWFVSLGISTNIIPEKYLDLSTVILYLMLSKSGC